MQLDTPLLGEDSFTLKMQQYENVKKGYSRKNAHRIACYLYNIMVRAPILLCCLRAYAPASQVYHHHRGSRDGEPQELYQY